MFQTTCKCNLRCTELANAQVKRKLFTLYHKMNKHEQRNYLMVLIGIIPVNRRRHGTYENPSESRRQFTITYNLPDNAGGFLRVCKGTFLDTFQISPTKLTTIIARKKNGEHTFREQLTSRNNK